MEGRTTVSFYQAFEHLSRPVEEEVTMPTAAAFI